MSLQAVARPNPFHLCQSVLSLQVPKNPERFLDQPHHGTTPARSAPSESASPRTSNLLGHACHHRTAASTTTRSGTAKSPAFRSNPTHSHSHPPARWAPPPCTAHSDEP